MELLLSSQAPYSPRPLSHADVVAFVLDVFLSVIADPLFLAFVLLMIYCLCRCFLRCRDGRPTPAEPDIETGARNLDLDLYHDHDAHPSPSSDHHFSPPAYDDDDDDDNVDDIRWQRWMEKNLKEIAPSFVFEKSWAEECGVKGSYECVICLEDIKDGEIARVLPACSHVFHKSCIDLWLRKKLICPICRASCC